MKPPHLILGPQGLIEEKKDGWALLYRIGAFCAIFSVSIIPVQIVVFLLSPPPEDAAGFMALFQEDILMGLLSMDLLYLVNNVLGLILFPALCLSLWKVDKSWSLIALLLGLFGSASFFGSNTAINFPYLSQQFEAAAGKDQSLYLAAGEAMMGLYKGTPYHIHYILGSLSLIILSFLMFRSPQYGPVLAWVGIITNVVALGLYIPEIGVYLSAFSALGYGIWFAWIAVLLLRISKKGGIELG